MKMPFEKLSSIADVLPGYHFRRGISHNPAGNAAAIQLKDVDQNGVLDWSSLEKVDASKVKENYFARVGDVLFVCRGSKNISFHIENEPPLSVVTNYFYIVRVDDRRVLPAFLSWYFDQWPAQKHLERWARQGTNVSVVALKEFKNLPIPLPPLPQQQKIVDLGCLVDQEAELSCRLALLRKRLKTQTLLDTLEAVS